MKSIFHLAFNVTDLDQARKFYGKILGCKEGRSSKKWVDFDFFNHQISLHLGEPINNKTTAKVIEHDVPIPHFGVVLELDQWSLLAEKLKQNSVEFLFEPFYRYQGEAGEHGSMFFYDPFGNAIEIKGIKNFDGIFEP